MSHHDAEGRGADDALLPPVPYLDRLVWLGGLASALLIVVILAITVVSVVFRYVLDRPLLGTDEASGFLVVATVMFGAAEALRRGDHINIDILTSVLPARMRHGLDIAGHLAVLVFAIMLLVTGWHTVTFSYGFDAYSTGAMEMPLWIPQSTMLAGAFLLGLVAVTRLLRLVLRRDPA